MSVPTPDRNWYTKPIVFATGNLARSAAVLFGLITLITVSCAGYVYFKAQQEKSIAVALREFQRSGADSLARMIAIEKKIRFNVARTSQFLTEASGPRNREALNGGSSDLEASAGQFASDIAEAKSIAKGYGGPELVDVLSDIERRFSEYHERGLTLAKANEAQDASTAESLKQPFAELGDEIQESLKHLDPALEVERQNRSAKTAAAGKQIDTLRDDTTTIALASCIITALACLIGVMAVRKWVVQPLSSLNRGFKRLAAGDTGHFSIDTHRSDEIGDLGRAFDDFRRIVLDSSSARVKAREQQELIELERDRTQAEKAHVEAQRSEAMRRMVDLIENETNVAVNGLIDLMDHMTGIASDMSGAADRLGGTTDSVSSASEQALVSMRAASRSTNELTGSIERVADQIRDAKATSDEAVLASRQASQSIEALSRVATEIDEVTGLIANITRQTGLLALNAGVEAARAGSEGHGFAIIAREIRFLAEQTSDATNKIGGLIRQVQGSTMSAVTAVDNISKAIDRVSNSSESITDSIKTQVGTTKIIAESVDGTTLSVTNVTTQIQRVADEVQSAQSMARKVEDVCSETADKVRALQMNLIKIVRTTSKAVNRRAHSRYEMNSPATIAFGGKVKSVKIADISEGGARLFGEIDAATRIFTLELPGMSRPLRSRVAKYKDGVIHSRFEGSEAEQAQLRLLVKRVADSGARRLAEPAA